MKKRTTYGQLLPGDLLMIDNLRLFTMFVLGVVPLDGARVTVYYTHSYRFEVCVYTTRSSETFDSTTTIVSQP